SLRIDDLLDLPTPRDFDSPAVRAVEHLVTELEQAWGDPHVEQASAEAEVEVMVKRRRELTLQLDRAIYRVFGVPSEIQREIAEFLTWLGGKRPGFHDIGIELPA